MQEKSRFTRRIAVIGMLLIALTVALPAGAAGDPPRPEPVRVPDHVAEANHAAVRGRFAEEETVRVVVFMEDESTRRTTTTAQRTAVNRQQQDRVLGRLTNSEFTLINRFSLVPGMVGFVSEAGFDKLLAMNEVITVYEDLPGTGGLDQSRVLINADDVQALGYTGNGVTVAVLDTGFDTDHPDLAGALVAEQCYVTIGNKCPPSNTNTGTSAEDDHGHGTNVTGIITSDGTVSELGVAPDADIVAVKVLDNNNSGQLSDWTLGIEWVAANAGTYSIDVINMSLQSGAVYSGNCDANQPAMATAVANAVAAGVTVIGITGNYSNTTQIVAPGCLTGVIATGAVDDVTDAIAGFSNTNAQQDVLAPGVNITTSAMGGGSSCCFAGTSAAAPHTSAVAALLLESEPTLTPAQVEARLESTGVNILDTRNSMTFPRIDALAALLAGPDINVTGNADFGNVLVFGGTQARTFTIENTGNTDLILNGTSFVGGNSGDFSITGSATSPVSAAGDTSLEVTCDPSAAGVRTTTLRITSNDPDEDPTDIPLTCTGIAPDLQIVKTNNVGGTLNLAVGGTWVWKLTITNIGTSDAVFSNDQWIVYDTLPNTDISYTGPTIGASSNFTGGLDCDITSDVLVCDAAGTTTFAPGGYIEVNILATPATTGTFTNPRTGSTCEVDPNYAVSESNESNNLCSNSVEVIAPDIDVSGTTDFGLVDVDGGTSVQTFTIENTGGANLSISSLDFGGTNPGDFSVTDSPSSPVFPSTSTTFDVTFNPSAGGPRSATLSIYSNDPDENPVVLNLTGFGTDDQLLKNPSFEIGTDTDATYWHRSGAEFGRGCGFPLLSHSGDCLMAFNAGTWTRKLWQQVVPPTSDPVQYMVSVWINAHQMERLRAFFGVRVFYTDNTREDFGGVIWQGSYAYGYRSKTFVPNKPVAKMYVGVLDYGGPAGVYSVDDFALGIVGPAP